MHCTPAAYGLSTKIAVCTEAVISGCIFLYVQVAVGEQL